MKKLTLLDGAVGTSLWEIAEKHQVEKVPVWKYNMEHPEFVDELCKGFAAAGSEIILANTFGANGPSVKQSSSYNPEDVVKKGVQLTKKALEGTNCKTCLAIGPLSMLIEPFGDLTVEEAQDIFEKMIGAGMDEKPDCILIQTFIDLEMMKIAAKVAKQYPVPVFCSLSFEKVGKTMMGQSVEDMIQTLEPMHVDAVGMNCSLGPNLAVPIIKEFSEKTDMPLIFKPNAGLPITNADGTVVSNYSAEMFANEVEPALEYVSYIGGCCGCNADYIRELKKKIK